MSKTGYPTLGEGTLSYLAVKLAEEVLFDQVASLPLMREANKATSWVLNISSCLESQQ